MVGFRPAGGSGGGTATAPLAPAV